MNNKTYVRLILSFGLIMLSCAKDYSDSGKLKLSGEETLFAKGGGSTQISGVGYLATSTECDAVSEGAAYAVRMTGDIEGCLFTYIDEYECSPSGTYREIGREHFVGTYKGQSGSFWTNYKFEAKYEGCAVDGAPLGSEILGRCQHPIADGSGTGVFSGVSGRVDMKDDIEAGNYPFRGHLKF